MRPMEDAAAVQAHSAELANRAQLSSPQAKPMSPMDDAGAEQRLELATPPRQAVKLRKRQQEHIHIGA